MAPIQDPSASPAPSDAPTLARRLGLFDITMLVMGSVIGAGIFVVPHDVAGLVHTPALILIAWVVGGAISVAGSLVYADLSRRRPLVGGQYAFLRDAYHPVVGFLYGWCLLCVIQSGGIASVAVVFARYVLQFGSLFAAHDTAQLDQATDATAVSLVAAAAIAGLTVLNCLGVRTGSTAQNIFMALKVLAIGTLIVVGLLIMQPPGEPPGGEVPVSVGGWEIASALAAALVPVLFSYGGWHTTTFMAAEVTKCPAESAEALARISALYEIEKRAKKLEPAERAELRQREASPMLQSFAAWMDSLRATTLPKSALGQAVTYATNQWDALNVYVTDGDLTIDNNMAERELRGIAVGRKNWNFFGSVNGGRTAAVLMSFTATCRQLEIDPWRYLTDVLRRIPNQPAGQLEQLRPDVWAKAQLANLKSEPG